MSPSQIVKSACPAGYTLKKFARAVADGIYSGNVDNETLRACKDWLANKTQQRKQAKRCARRGHTDIHQRLQARKVEHCTGRGTLHEGSRS